VTLCWRNQCETVQLLTLTSDSIAPALWPAKSPDLNPADYRIWSAAGACIAAGFVTLTRWSRTWSRVGTFPPGVRQWNGQVVASTSSSLHSSTWRTFWTQTLSTFDICTNVHFDIASVWLPIADIFVLGDLTKPAITIAAVDRFYWNLEFYLQLEVALLLQNFAKIRHCSPELWKCMQWFTFFRTQCRTHIFKHTPLLCLNLSRTSGLETPKPCHF